MDGQKHQKGRAMSKAEFPRYPMSTLGRPAGKRCPCCGDWLVVVSGNWGKEFLGCPLYPECNHREGLDESGRLTQPKRIAELTDPNTYNHYDWDEDGFVCEEGK
jgi:ssDNA-binding Zn-finger/Zn-ribbon topoisomerase 1